MVVVALAIVAKNSLAFLAMMVLVHVTPFRILLAAMGRLGLPPLIVSTLQFMERQIHILGDELGRMVQARRSRSFRRSGRLDYVLLTGLIGMLFLRSFERGERVHARCSREAGTGPSGPSTGPTTHDRRRRGSPVDRPDHPHPPTSPP